MNAAMLRVARETATGSTRARSGVVAVSVTYARGDRGDTSRASGGGYFVTWLWARGGTRAATWSYCRTGVRMESTFHSIGGPK